MGTITLKEKVSHNGLNEGRTTGLAFAFAKQTKENNYETIQGISTCKDYLNDVVTGEQNKRNIGVIYGYAHKYQKLFEGKPAFLVVAPKPYKVNAYTKDRKYMFLKKEVACPEMTKTMYKHINENLDMFVKLLNDFEEYFEMEGRTTAFSPDEFKYIKNGRFTEIGESKPVIFRLASGWVKTSYMISLCSFIIRCQYNAKELLDYKSFVNGKHPKGLLNNSLLSHFNNQMKERIKDIRDHNIPKDLHIESNLNVPSCIHNDGFLRHGPKWKISKELTPKQKEGIKKINKANAPTLRDKQKRLKAKRARTQTVLIK